MRLVLLALLFFSFLGYDAAANVDEDCTLNNRRACVVTASFTSSPTTTRTPQESHEQGQRVLQGSTVAMATYTGNGGAGGSGSFDPPAPFGISTSLLIAIVFLLLVFLSMCAMVVFMRLRNMRLKANTNSTTTAAAATATATMVTKTQTQTPTPMPVQQSINSTPVLSQVPPTNTPTTTTTQWVTSPLYNDAHWELVSHGTDGEYYINNVTGETKWPDEIQSMRSARGGEGGALSTTSSSLGTWPSATIARWERVSHTPHDYYENRATGETKWPDELDEEERDDGGGGDMDATGTTTSHHEGGEWILINKNNNNSERPYYYNSLTGESQWADLY